MYIFFSNINNAKLLETDERSFYIVYSNFIKNTVEPLQANSDLRVALSCPYIKLITGLNDKFSGLRNIVEQTRTKLIKLL